MNTFSPLMRLTIMIAIVLGAFLIWAFPGTSHAQIPREADGYRREFTRIMRSVGGLDAPVANLAAQVHQESTWNCSARSRVGASGCGQFMPATAKWMAELDPGLRSASVGSPAWDFRAQAVYMAWLEKRVKADNACERLAFSMQAYNSGLGWVYKRQKLSATPGRCFDAACNINPGVLASNQKEAQEYPVRILRTLSPRYASWGPDHCMAVPVVHVKKSC